MAIAFDASSSANVGSSNNTTLSWSHTCTGSTLVLVVAVGMQANVAVSSVTYGGQNLTFRVSANESGNTRAELWTLVNPPTGANTVTVTLPSAAFMGGVAHSYTGVDQGTPVGNTASANSSGNVNSLSLNITSATNDVVVDGVAKRNSTENITAGGSQSDAITTITTSGTANNNIVVGSSDQPGAASVTMSWSHSGVTRSYSLTALSLNPVGVGISVTVFDTLTTSESRSVVLGGAGVSVYVSDGITTGETASALPSSLFLTVFDTATVSDLQAVQRGGPLSLIVFDTSLTSEFVNVVPTGAVVVLRPTVGFSTAFLSATCVTANPVENLYYPKSRLTDRENPYRPCRSRATSQQDFVFSLGGTIAAYAAYVFLLDVNFSSAQLATGLSATSTDASFNADNASITIARNGDVARYNLLTQKSLPGVTHLRLRIPAQTPVDGAPYFSLGLVGIVSALTQFSWNVEAYEVEIRARYLGQNNLQKRGSDFYYGFPWQATTSLDDLAAWQQLATYGQETVWLAFHNIQGSRQDVHLAQHEQPVRMTRAGDILTASAQVREYLGPLVS